MQLRLNAMLSGADMAEPTGASDLQNLLHPAMAFEHPRNVVHDPDLTLNEKRAILASWASDACAIEAAPTLRQPPGGKQPVRFDEIMDALRKLDQEYEQQSRQSARYRRVLRDQRLRSRRRPVERGEGQPRN